MTREGDLFRVEGRTSWFKFSGGTEEYEGQHALTLYGEYFIDNTFTIHQAFGCLPVDTLLLPREYTL